ncbi:E3 ubiquitin-protein ligase DTX4-like [Glandiceps talaboti]
MATSSTDTSPAVFVWEWLNDQGRWRPYDPSVVREIESAYPGGGIFSLSTADPKLISYNLDFNRMQQISETTGTSRPVRRKKYAQNSAPAKGVVWQWLGDIPGSWNTYDLEIGCLLEAAYVNKQTQINLSHTACRLPYIVDITAMTQVRQGSGFIRQIRRIELPSVYPPAGSLDSDSDSSSNSTGNTIRTVTPSSYKLKHSVSAPCGISDSNPGNIRSKVRRSNSTRLSRSDSNDSATANVQSSSSIGSTTDDATPSTSGITSPSSDSGIVASASSSSVGMATSPLPLLAGPSSSASSASTSALVAVPLPPSSVPVGRMVRSVSTPCTISTSRAHATTLSPVMTGMTSMLMSPAVPIVLSHPPVLRMTPPPTSRNDCKPVPGIKPPKKRRRLSLMKVTDPEDVLKHYVSKVKKPPTEDCPICFEELCSSSGYEENKATSIVFKLEKCKHIFHKSCLAAMYSSGPKDGSLQCPTCKAIYGVKHGNQPPGSMDYHVIPYSLPGYRECDAIRIIYNIPPGTQGPEHPHPGKRYSARGFPRHCYLPNNDKGRKVLRLLITAWDRRLLFTVGISATTGEANTVTWNEIHHKTEFGSNLTGHGYPDLQYLDNVLMELASQGVTEDDL